MSAQYLLRFDDICPTMRWSVWEQIEPLLVLHRIRPILAVVPDNHDEKLRVDPPAPDFWNRVRTWQERGWTIGMHGYQHRYSTNRAGIIGLNRRSEFAGRPEPAQRDALASGLRILREHGVEPTVWVAPAHSFDHVTVRLLRQMGLTTISDGFSLYPFRDAHGMFWIPQQLWAFRPKPRGVWTVCLHINGWTSRDIERFREDLWSFAGQVVDVPTVLATYGDRRRSVLDGLTAARRRWSLKARRAGSALKRLGH